MNLIMTMPKSRTAHKNRRAFLGQLNGVPFGEILDLDFDNDNERPITAEELDWCQSRLEPHHLT